MNAHNPKREFTINYDVEAIKKAVFSIVDKETHKYVLVSDDQVLNQVRIRQKGVLLDSGYHIDFLYKKRGAVETDLVIEVSRPVGAVDTPTEIHNANYILKEIAEKFSAYLSGNVDDAGKAKTAGNAGCMLFVIVAAVAESLYLLLS